MHIRSNFTIFIQTSRVSCSALYFCSLQFRLIIQGIFIGFVLSVLGFTHAEFLRFLALFGLSNLFYNQLLLFLVKLLGLIQ